MKHGDANIIPKNINHDILVLIAITGWLVHKKKTLTKSEKTKKQKNDNEQVQIRVPRH